MIYAKRSSFIIKENLFGSGWFDYSAIFIISENYYFEREDDWSSSDDSSNVSSY